MEGTLSKILFSHASDAQHPWTHLLPESRPTAPDPPTLGWLARLDLRSGMKRVTGEPPSQFGVSPTRQ